MKNKKRLYFRQIAAFFLVFVMIFSQTSVIYAKKNVLEASEEVVDVENTIEITNAEELMAFAEACKSDTYSLGKIVELRADISLKEVEFEGISYFNGTFHGNGYKITNLMMDETGSQYGLFRYIGEFGIVSDLHVTGTIAPNGSKIEIGGIAGVNYGLIDQCSFTGAVYGEDKIGAIAGLNCSTGKILNCMTVGLVLGTDYTGGIAGMNEGVITGCTNKAKINIEELEPELDLGGIDLGTMNFAQTVVTRSYMGGIAGSSSGIIKDCYNYGEIGYAHTGYNVGGIAGAQKGMVLNCINEGTVYGRKDVGGIVGQAEPYVESKFLSEQIDLARDDVERINRSMNRLSGELEKYSNEAKGYSDSLATQLESTTNALNNRLNQIESAIPENNPQAKGYMNNINEAMKEIERIQNADDELSQEDLDAIAVQMEIIEHNTELLNQVTSGNISGGLGEDTSISLNGEQIKGDVEGLSESVKKSMDALTSGIETLTGQIETLADHVYASTAVLRGEEDLITDVSSIKNAAQMDGVISGCVNKGTVDGDLNVAGIAGTMNLEYGDDPESNLSLSEDVDVAISSKINNVIIDCANYGQINGKKNYTGTIVGLQELGLIYQCEGYGHIDASMGMYVGGIAGISNATIQKSYAMLDLSGKDYVGGIAGEGTIIKDCFSVVKIDSTGECIGSIAGFAEKLTGLSGNYFVKEQYDGVDDISYTGSAEPMLYEEMIAKEDIPEGFYMVQVAFEVEGKVLKETMIGYGSTLQLKDFPALEDREDAYVVWPEEDVYTNITNNVTIVAEYRPWTQSLASMEQAEKGKPYFIAVEKFYEGAKLQLADVDETMVLSEQQTLLYAYSWDLETVNNQVISSVEGHFYLPEVKGDVELWLQTENGWEIAEYAVDGSYLVSEIPVGTSFTLVELAVDNSNIYLIAVAGVVVFVLVFLGIIVHNKRKKNRKKG